MVKKGERLKMKEKGLEEDLEVRILERDAKDGETARTCVT